MASHTAVIVNHRVALPGTSTHGAIATHRLDYVRTRLGAVREPTEDDLRREEQKSREDALGYISHRQGAVLDEESNCALFDASGVADYGQVKHGLMEAQGAILTSVVTMRREDAEELGLQTKQDFERFLRAHWSEHLEQMGVMEPQDVRWVAAFHTNSDKNFHVHVISWDGSGRFDSLIPKRELEDARQDLVAKALAPARQAVSNVRTQARDDLAANIRDCELTQGQRQKMREIADELPESGSLKYGNLARRQPELKRKVDDLVRERIEASPELKRKVEAYEKAVERHADLKGLKDTARDAHRAAAMDDLRARLGNAQLKQVKQFAGITDKPCQRATKKPTLPEGERVVMPADRKREQVISQELSSRLTKAEKAELANALKTGEKPSQQTAQKVADLPSSKQYAKQEGKSRQGLKARIAGGIARAGIALNSLVDQATGGGRGDTGDDAGKLGLRWGARAMRAVASQVLKAIKSPETHKPEAPKQELKANIHLKR